ncbi:aldehyde dehydrogenase family protein [Microbispora sp. H10836]|uniref:aldehyde dehydrogenase family protein n=1 Tax=Microbispora sp. H10836 TaxID=2729106 RepID=UPI0014744CD2
MSVSDLVTGEATTLLHIGGRDVPTPETLPVHDPAAPSRIVGRMAAATPAHASDAVAAAHAAFPAWARRSAPERAAALTAALDALPALAAESAATLTAENGKVLGESHADLAVFDMRCRHATSLADSFETRTVLPAPPFDTEVLRLPIGVVTVVVPFNWPLAILAASMPYALVAGNTVVVKPPPTTPLSVVRTVRAVAEQLPPGVLNVVTGTNEAVEPLLTDPRVQHVVFTGSTGGGRAVMALAAQSLAGVTLELGGNDPAILLDDVNLDEKTVSALVNATFMTSGQVCMAVKRLYVPRSRYVETVDALGAALDRQSVGAGTDPGATMGPLHTAAGRDRVVAMLDQARARGAEVREFGTVAASATADGYFLRPSLVLDPAPELAVVVDEQFGPTLPVLPYDDVDRLVTSLDDEWSGLCSSVWSADPDRARDVARRMRTGTTWVNQANATAADDRAPFGGFRQSGIGREMGQEGLHAFTEPHVVTSPAG